MMITVVVIVLALMQLLGDEEAESSTSEDEDEPQSPSGFFGRELPPLENPPTLPVTPAGKKRNGKVGAVVAGAGSDSKRKIVKLTRSSTYITDYSTKIRKTTVSKVLNANVKASRIVTAIVDVLSRVYIRARHLALIMRWFKLGKCHKTRHFGTYRVELAVQLFSRVVDNHNIDLVLRELTSFECACLMCRLGVLNLFNPLKPEGPICLGRSDVYM